jgi:hypothetical protein
LHDEQNGFLQARAKSLRELEQGHLNFPWKQAHLLVQLMQQRQVWT